MNFGLMTRPRKRAPPKRHPEIIFKSTHHNRGWRAPHAHTLSRRRTYQRRSECERAA